MVAMSGLQEEQPSASTQGVGAAARTSPRGGGRGAGGGRRGRARGGGGILFVLFS